MILEKKISVIVPHVRDDYPHAGEPGTHVFHYLLESLQAQDFPVDDFELILPDTQYDRRADCFEKNPQPFTVKHVPKKSTLWTRIGFCDISNGYNTGIIHADGKLLLLLSSGCEFEPDALSICWHWYRQGWLAGFMYDVKAGARIVRADTRRDELYAAGGIKRYRPTDTYTAFYGHQCASLQACLDVNGFDEQFDGTKGWNDVEMGIRLSKAGYHFVHDESLELIEHAHTDLPWGTFLSPDCEDGRWAKFTERRHEQISYRTLDPAVSFEANRYPFPKQQMEGIKRRVIAEGGEIPPWHTIYTDHGLCFDLKALWRERRKADGLSC